MIPSCPSQTVPHPPVAARLPDELVLQIGRFLWYSHTVPPQQCCNYPRISRCSQLKQLISRSTAVLGVCCSWRRVLHPEYCRSAVGDCQLDSVLMRHPFICTGSTVEVWLRFDGILLFGSWATEWAAMTLGHGSPGFSIQTLTIVIVESPVSAITPNEDMRARMLADVCSVALKPQAIGFMSQSCASKDTIAPGCDVGKKFGCIYSHMSRAQNPPALTSIETGTIDSDYMLWLVANSAGTLKCLRIRSTRPSTLQQLLCDTVDDIVFDSLKDILLILDMNDSLLQPFNITRQYFPSLECLDVVIPPQDIKQNRESSLSIFEHSFLTDLFFYAPGPIRMLNYPLTWDSVEVLTPDILCNIRHVALYEVSLEGEHLLDQDESNQLLANILSRKHIRTVFLNNSASETFIELPLFCAHLHTLGIPNYALTAVQIMTLLRDAPSLEVLYFQLAQSKPGTLSIDAVHTHPLSVSIRSFGIGICADYGSGDCIHHLFGLVALLPYLQQITLPGDFDEPLQEYIQQASESKRYRWSTMLLKNLVICRSRTPASSQPYI